MKPYTILLLYPDYLANNYGEDTFTTVVIAPTAEAAINLAQHEAAAVEHCSEDTNAFEDFLALGVFEGDHINYAP